MACQRDLRRVIKRVAKCGFVIKGLMVNAHHCMWTGGKPPLGYDVVDKKRVDVSNDGVSVKFKAAASSKNDTCKYKCEFSGDPYGN